MVTCSHHNPVLGLWVPAFAGTTVEDVATAVVPLPDHKKMPLFCPTSQTALPPAYAYRKPLIRLTSLGYCAWGCFRAFVPGLPHAACDTTRLRPSCLAR
ncbi:hypothetical protein FXV83_21560 [Bradyrhizobium hipponense]|uniref:Uncharacterized protein n=1 Tax=Bradyrhizobium hipponense TaxID=2605638 RepID=A0A5S4YKS7_9BRAD|nr:hypothetical protein FXV83_21560 [Bradyrhizobium hipponense]